MKVRALIRFNDLEDNVTREIGDIFEVSEERYNEIIECGGVWVEKITEDLKKLKREELEKVAREKGVPEDVIEKATKKEDLIEIIKGEA